MTDQKLTPHISIAMATYNGAKYLTEQLQSLTQQLHLPFELVACDDGSTDGTVGLLEEFKTVSPFPVRIYRNNVNLGYAGNFFRAASLCKGEWVAFCDQDDVWLSNKLAAAAEAITRNSEACLILQNSYICNEALQYSGRLFPFRLKPVTYRRHSLPIVWVWEGFLQTVRRDLFSLAYLIERPANQYNLNQPAPHDQWVCTIAGAIGDVTVLAEPIALYRRHTAAVSGSHAAVKLGDMVRAVLKTNSSDYELLARTWSSYVGYLRELSARCEDPAWQNNLSVAADRHEPRAEIYLQRAALYRGAPLVDRIRCFRKILSSGGYVGMPGHDMGPRSAIKDLAAVVGIF